MFVPGSMSGEVGCYRHVGHCLYIDRYPVNAEVTS
jgi:hypothetical protein